jgi:hypothetical protein
MLTLQAQELAEVVERANTPLAIGLDTHDLIHTHDRGSTTSTEGSRMVGSPDRTRN